MPTITVDVENTEQTVTRRVVMDVVYDLIAAFGIAYKVNVIYPNATDPEDLPISVAAPRKSPHQNMKVLIEATEEFVEKDLATTLFNPHEHSPIFSDQPLGVVIAPVYARKRLTLNLRFRFPDRNSAKTQMNDMRRHVSLHQKGLFHEVEYEYLIPKVNVVILTEIHRLREKLAGYGEDLSQWLIDHFCDQATTLANADGSQRALAKEELQTGILGNYEYEITPDEPEPNQSKSVHTLTVSYVTEYDCPISTVMTYPILVHNQAINSDFYQHTLPFELADRLALPSQSRRNLDHFTANNYVTGFPMGAPVPTFMQWLPPTIPSYTEGLLRVMCMVDPNDRYDLVNFQALGDLSWRQPYLDFLMQEHTRLPFHRHSPLFVALYENDKMLGADAITIDEDLNVRSTFPMDLRKHYHIWVAIHTNWEFLKKDAQDRLRKNGAMCRTLMLGIDPHFPEQKLPGSLSGDYIPKRDYDTAVDDLNRRSTPIKGEPRHLNLRIGHFVVAV